MKCHFCVKRFHCFVDGYFFLGINIFLELIYCVLKSKSLVSYLIQSNI